MEFHIIDLKSEMKRNGITMLDLSECNFEMKLMSMDDIKISKVLILDESFEGRPDLLQYRAGYSVINALDIILKFNDITNPFSIKSEDIIIIPDLEDAKKYYKKEKASSTVAIDFKKLYIDESKKPSVDGQRVKQLEKIAKRRSTGSTEIMPTNLLKAGQSAYTIDSKNGTITLSPFNSI